MGGGFFFWVVTRLNNGYEFVNIFIPEKKNSGLTLLKFYSTKFNHSSEEEWKGKIESGQIFVNNLKIVDPDFLLSIDNLNKSAGSLKTTTAKHFQVCYRRPPWVEKSVPLFQPEHDIIYSDRDIIITFKRSGQPVMCSGSYQDHTLISMLRHHFQNNNIAPMHRLGRGTTGALVWGQTDHSKKSLAKQFQDRKVKKIYLALVSGLITAESLQHLETNDKQEYKIEAAIGEIQYEQLKLNKTLYAAVSSDDDNNNNNNNSSKKGKHSVSWVKILKLNPHDQTTLVQVRIETGRPHQIRIHMSYIGFPLVGDPLYVSGGRPKISKETLKEKHCNETSSQSVKQDKQEREDKKRVYALPGDCGYWLHSWQIQFTHPTTNEIVNFVCAPRALQLHP